MATELNMPQMGYDMQEGTLVRWLKAVGDEVSLGDPVAEIETDKAVVEFESTAEGVLLKFLVEEGTTVAVGEVIAMVGAEGEDVDGEVATAGDDDAPSAETDTEAAGDDAASVEIETEAAGDDDMASVETETAAAGDDDTPSAETETAAAGDDDTPSAETETAAAGDDDMASVEIETEAASEPDDSEEAAAQPMEREEPERAAIPLPAASIVIRVSPVARRLAAEQGIDLSGIEGTGPGGRILRADVIAAAEAAALDQSPEAEGVEEPMEEVEAAHPVEAVEPVEEPVAEETMDEPIVEEAMDEEPVAEEAMDEEPVAEEAMDEEPVAEEAMDEEPVAEEPGDEPVAEEAMDEEPVAEEPGDEPVAEETADEPVAEETVAEPDAEEAIDEPVAEEAVEPVEEPEIAAALPAGVTPLSRMRQQIARVTTTSKTTIPHFYVTTDIDMTDVMELRRQINDALEGEARVSVNDLIIKACVDALKRHPNLNATFTDDGIHMHESINIGIAISVGDGLIMPAILDCGGKSLSEISAASQDLARRSESGTLQSDEYTGGTFSISNMGMFDVTSFVAIIQPPQSAVLAVGTVQDRVVVQDDDIVVREMMSATLSVDHRVSDGVEGAQFITDVKQQLEHPLRLLL